MQQRLIVMLALAVLIPANGVALGQYSRSGGGLAGYGGGGLRQGGASLGSSPHGLQSNFSRAFRTGRGDAQVIIRQTPPSHRGRRNVSERLRASPSGQFLSSRTEKEPGLRRFRPPHPHRHPRHFPGIVIIEAPGFYDLTVIREIVPSGGWVEQPMARPYSQPGAQRGPGQLAPFDPTPQEVVERMLVLAGVKKGDVVYDLGAGDGRVVITAAKIYGVKAVGFEVDAGLVKLARENVREQGVEQLVEIRQQDFLSADLSAATVVTLYLSYDGNLAVKPKLMRELQPGSRVVSYIFDMGDWPAKITEAYRDATGDTHMLYLWHTAEPMLYGDAATEIPR